MNIDDVIPGCINLMGYTFASIQQNPVFQVIEFVLSALASILIIGFKLYQWWHKAKKDGKIDDKEIEELGKIVDEVQQHKEDKE